MQLNTPPKAGSRSSDLAGMPLVITEVKGERVVETSLGEATAVVIDVLVLDRDVPTGFPGDDDYHAGDPILRHVPEVLIFWSVVQRQLLSDDFAVPVAGKFEQKGKAYTLNELTEAELTTVQGLL
ncbi:MAG: hypothetical protein ACR2M4_02875 [Actinomycetota bacterium]